MELIFKVSTLDGAHVPFLEIKSNHHYHIESQSEHLKKDHMYR